jgi:hypothetical protein
MRTLILALLLSSTAFAQVIVERSFLLRAETTSFDPYSGMAHFCVLVYPDGKYRLERTLQDPHGGTPETKVYINELADAGIKQLMATLDDADLQAINTPERHGGIIQNLDTLMITIPREHTIQNLVFENTDQRKPYEKKLKPVLAWMKDIQKKKGPVAKDEQSTNCAAPRILLRAPIRSEPETNPDNQ